MCVGDGTTAHFFTEADGTALTAPMDETDHDEDGYVECEFFEETWVNFKLFGLLGLTLIFLIIQGVWINRHGSEPSEGPKDA